MNVHKEMRKQLRLVVKESLEETLLRSIEDKFNKTLDERLTVIDDYVRKELNRQDSRAKAIQGFVVREVQFNISNQLHNAHVTMLAWQEVMQERLEKTASPELSALFSSEEMNKAVDEKKLAVQKRLEEKALADQQLAIKAKEADEINTPSVQPAAVENPPAPTAQTEQS